MTSHTQRLQAMSLGLSLIYFGVPAILMIVGFYAVMPSLIRRGVLSYYAYAAGLGLPLLVMLIAALVVYRVEGNPMRWQSLMERFRYRSMTTRDWLWTGGIFAVQLLIYSQFARLTRVLIDRDVILLPKALPAFVDPRTVFTTETLDSALGGLRGNWMVLLVSIVLLVVNVVGEEFWWRGVVYPRQELAFGRWVWVIHGAMWALFHAYKHWDLFSLLPMTLGLSFAVFYLQNNTPGLIIHFVGNGAGLIPILLGILGR